MFHRFLPAGQPLTIPFEFTVTVLATAVTFHALGLTACTSIADRVARLIGPVRRPGLPMRRIRPVGLLVLANGWVLATCGSWWYDAYALTQEWGPRWIGRLLLAAAINGALVGGAIVIRRSPKIVRLVGGGLRACAGLVVVVAVWWVCWGVSPPRRSTAPAPAPADGRPNVLLIVLDTVRADYLSCYGHKSPTTPHLDALADRGVLFENCITPGGWTAPAHASLFTGLYQSQHHIEVTRNYLGPRFDTLAEILAGDGYQTVGTTCNEWLDMSQGYAQGFGLWYNVKQTMVTSVWRFLPALAAFRCNASFVAHTGDALGVNLLPTLQLDKGTRLGVRLLIDWLEDVRQPDRPFFAFVDFMETHHPLKPPVGFRRQFVPSEDFAYSYSIETIPAYRTPPEQIDGRKTRVWRQLYEASLAYLDEEVAALLDYLERRAMLDDTLVIVVSDHGEHLGEHGIWGHYWGAYEPLARVPLIVRYPPLFSGGRRVTGLVQINDLFATILSVCKSEYASKYLPALRDLSRIADADEVRDLAMFEFPDARVMNRPEQPLQPISAARQGPWKLVDTGGSPTRLYRLDGDPAESSDLASTSSDQVRRLRSARARRAEELMTRTVPDSWLDRGAPTRDDLRERLMDLGYVQSGKNGSRDAPAAP